MGPVFRGGEVVGGDRVVLDGGSTQELMCSGGSGTVRGVNLREDTLRSWTCSLVVADAS